MPEEAKKCPRSWLLTGGSCEVHQAMPKRRPVVFCLLMPMTPFVERFPHLGPAETLSIRSTGTEDLPDGSYSFMELYCNEPGCDCRRVILLVLQPDTGWVKVWASISYGWESPAFYRKWTHLADPADLTGPSLDPLNPQTQSSPVLLEIFRHMLRSSDYIERLKRHYQMFRTAVEAEHKAKNSRAG
jgi:hypothetical protein